MIQPATLSFLADLDKNNDRDWFEAHRNEYLTAKEDFLVFITALAAGMQTLEPRLADQQPKDAVYRIFRDVRFSKNKTPYKSHFSAYFSKGGRKWPGAGYYLHLQPGQSFLAAGVWMPESPLLKSIRQEIDYSYDEFQQILDEKSFKKHFGKLGGDALQKVPAGYDAANPAAGYLKMKSFIADAKTDDADFLNKNAVKLLTAVYSSAKPLVDFLNRALD